VLGGATLMSIGILGEYVGKIYEQAKNRPLYLVSRTFNIVERYKHQDGAEFMTRSEYR
jgi:dolichol-phosphate mannosyltransferase